MNNFLAILLMVVAGVAAKCYLNSTEVQSGQKPASSPAPAARTAAPVTKSAAPAGMAGVNPQHVAAITAAIFTATRGQGRILNIVPQQSSPMSVSSSATSRWRAVGIMAAVGRRVAPTWKR